MVPKKIATLNLNHRCGRWGFPPFLQIVCIPWPEGSPHAHGLPRGTLRYAEAMWNKLLSKNKRPPAVRYPFCKMILLKILHQNDSQQKDVFHPDSPMNQNQLHCKMVFCRIDTVSGLASVFSTADLFVSISSQHLSESHQPENISRDGYIWRGWRE